MTEDNTTILNFSFFLLSFVEVIRASLENSKHSLSFNFNATSSLEPFLVSPKQELILPSSEFSCHFMSNSLMALNSI